MRYFVNGHGGDDGQTTFVPAGTRLLLYAPAGHNLDFRIGLNILTAEGGTWVQDHRGLSEGDKPEPVTNIAFSALQPEEQKSAELHFERESRDHLVIIGLKSPQELRLCSQTEVCEAGWVANERQHAPDCTGLFGWFRENKFGGDAPTDLDLHVICCLGEGRSSPTYEEYSGDEGNLAAQYKEFSERIIALVDERKFVTAINLFDTVGSARTRDSLLHLPRLEKSLALAREQTSVSGDEDWWKESWQGLNHIATVSDKPIDAILVQQKQPWIEILWRWLSAKGDEFAGDKQLCELVVTLTERLEVMEDATRAGEVMDLYDKVVNLSGTIPAEIYATFAKGYEAVWKVYARFARMSLPVNMPKTRNLPHTLTTSPNCSPRCSKSWLHTSTRESCRSSPGI